MSIDPSTIKPGGRVSVTLTDGTKIIDSPVTQDGKNLRIIDDCILLLEIPSGRTFPRIASIDAHTPPTPEWDWPDVFAVVGVDGSLWWRLPKNGEWVSPGASEIERKYGPCSIHAVYAPGVAVYADGVER